MANSLTNILPKILARAVMVLRESCIMPRLVNSDYSTLAAKKGATIDVPIPTAVGTRDVTPSNTPPSPTDTTPGTVPITLDQWKQNDPIYLTDKDLVEIDKDRHFLPMQLEEAIRGLSGDVNEHILGKYKGALRGIYGFVGTAGTTPFGTGVLSQSATHARRELNKQLCHRANRRGVLDHDADAQALEIAAMADAEKIMSAQVKLEGEIGRKYGIDWTTDDGVLTHTAGTLVEGTGATKRAAVNEGSNLAIGDDTFNLDNGAFASIAGTIVRGDIISFAGHSQTYTVIDNASSGNFSAAVYTVATNAIANLKIYPALKAAVLDDEIITLRDDHVVNLVFHRDAFAFATRPLVQNTLDLELGSKIYSMQDPHTGLVLRLEVSRQHKQVAWEFDILWGAELVRPELAVRIAG
jgi:hypothetical protein